MFYFFRLLFGLGIRHVGITTAKDISAHFGTFQIFWSYLLNEVEKEVEKENEIEKEVEKEVENEAEKEVEEELQNNDGESENQIEGMCCIFIFDNFFITVFNL